MAENQKDGNLKRKYKIIGIIVILAILCIASAGYALLVTKELMSEREKGGELTVVDDMGRVVKLSLPVTRVVSTAPSNTEILFAIGAGDFVVGVDNYSDYPAEALNLTKVGDFVSLNVELIYSLKPDVVFAYYGQRAGIERLSELGIPVITIRPQTLEDVLNEIMLIGTVCGKREKAENLMNELRQRINIVVNLTQNLGDNERPRVYYECWNSPYISAGPGSFMNDLIRIAGGTNIAANASRDYPVLAEEFILYANPEIIITSSMNLDTPEKIMQRPNWQNIDAVKHGKVYAVDDNLISRAGPRIVDGLETLAKLIHPEIFGGNFA
ncbi:MAG: cobalamin-binding protein [Thermoplasmata archaeon]|nr:cobalamin-binding protein [Thermoplasmata archaeon]